MVLFRLCPQGVRGSTCDGLGHACVDAKEHRDTITSRNNLAALLQAKGELQDTRQA